MAAALELAQDALRGQLLQTRLLIGGALGNVVDRILYGAVADFLNMSCCGIEKSNMVFLCLHIPISGATSSTLAIVSTGP